MPGSHSIQIPYRKKPLQPVDIVVSTSFVEIPGPDNGPGDLLIAKESRHGKNL
jgi:hypothetical protein